MNYHVDSLHGFEPTAKSSSKSNIIQFALSEERVNPGISPDELSHQFGMFFQQVSGDVFEMSVTNLPRAASPGRCLRFEWHDPIPRVGVLSRRIVPRPALNFQLLKAKNRQLKGINEQSPLYALRPKPCQVFRDPQSRMAGRIDASRQIVRNFTKYPTFMPDEWFHINISKRIIIGDHLPGSRRKRPCRVLQRRTHRKR